MVTLKTHVAWNCILYLSFVINAVNGTTGKKVLQWVDDESGNFAGLTENKPLTKKDVPKYFTKDSGVVFHSAYKTEDSIHVLLTQPIVYNQVVYKISLTDAPKDIVYGFGYVVKDSSDSSHYLSGIFTQRLPDSTNPLLHVGFAMHEKICLIAGPDTESCIALSSFGSTTDTHFHLIFGFKDKFQGNVKIEQDVGVFLMPYEGKNYESVYEMSSKNGYVYVYPQIIMNNPGSYQAMVTLPPGNYQKILFGVGHTEDIAAMNQTKVQGYYFDGLSMLSSFYTKSKNFSPTEEVKLYVRLHLTTEGGHKLLFWKKGDSKAYVHTAITDLRFPLKFIFASMERQLGDKIYLKPTKPTVEKKLETATFGCKLTSSTGCPGNLQCVSIDEMDTAVDGLCAKEQVSHAWNVTKIVLLVTVIVICAALIMFVCLIPRLRKRKSPLVESVGVKEHPSPVKKAKKDKVDESTFCVSFVDL